MSVQVSVRAEHKQRSTQTRSKKPSTRINETTTHVERTEVTSMGYLDPKRYSSTGDTAEDHTGVLILCTVLPDFIK